MKHTKGPWVFMRQGEELHGEEGHEVMSICLEMPIPICDIPVKQIVTDHNPMGADREYIVDKAESIANGYLIAAAPDLLEACHKAYCKLVELEVDADHTLYVSEELKTLEDAINKAEGR